MENSNIEISMVDVEEVDLEKAKAGREDTYLQRTASLGQDESFDYKFGMKHEQYLYMYLKVSGSCRFVVKTHSGIIYHTMLNETVTNNSIYKVSTEAIALGMEVLVTITGLSSSSYTVDIFGSTSGDL